MNIDDDYVPPEPTDADVPLIELDECKHRQPCGCPAGEGHTCDPGF